MRCAACGSECIRDEVDIGVGIQYGPWNCPNCGWGEHNRIMDENAIDLTFEEMQERAARADGKVEL